MNRGHFQNCDAIHALLRCVTRSDPVFPADPSSFPRTNNLMEIFEYLQDAEGIRLEVKPRS